MRTRQTLPSLAFACFLICFFPSASAQAWVQIGNTLEGEASGDQFGNCTSMSHDGTVLAVGANENDGSFPNAGHVRVFELIQGNWAQRGADIDGGSENEESGKHVSLNADGSTLAVGAPRHNSNKGKVTVYDWDGSNWVQRGNALISPDHALFGFSLELNGDGSVLAIGAPWEFTFLRGRTTVYEWDGSNWVQRGSGLEGTTADDHFGWSLDLSEDGNTLAVGAVANYYPNSGHGYVRVFEWNGVNWIQKGGDILGASFGDMAGWSVSLSAGGGVLAVGARNNYGTASSYLRVFEWNGNAWTQRGSFPNLNAALSVSLSGNGKAVAVSNPYNGTSPGHVTIHRWDGSNWFQSGNTLTTTVPNNLFGYWVHLNSDGNTVAYGTPDEEVSGSSRGTVRVFSDFSVGLAEAQHLDWKLTAAPNPCDGTMQLQFGNPIRRCTIKVRNALGEILFSDLNFQTSKIDLELPGPPGIYFIEASTPEGRRSVVKVLKR